MLRESVITQSATDWQVLFPEKNILPIFALPQRIFSCVFRSSFTFLFVWKNQFSWQQGHDPKDLH